MRLKIIHRTEYAYSEPVAYALQRLRLVPYSDQSLKVLDWALAIEGAKQEVAFVDQYGNETRLVSVSGEPRTISVEARGDVETVDNAGVVGQHRGFAPLWLFHHETPLTRPGEGIEALAASIGGARELDRLHALMHAVADQVGYETGRTASDTTAEDAFARKSGVCQDHAHIMIAATRLLGMPARYVSGYLKLDEATEQAASHAWAEAYVQGLGWVGFDPSNRMSPDGRYVRLATGRDYRDAAPISGIRLGSSEELLTVQITVEQQ